MTPTASLTLSAAAGMLLSLFFSYVPKAAPWFAGLDPTHKRLVLLLALALAAALPLALACARLRVWPGPYACTEAGAEPLLAQFLAAAIASQSTYQFTKHTPSADDERMIDPAFIP